METGLFYVYVLQNLEHRLYIGFTTDLNKRVQRHQENRSGWTKEKGPWELVYIETYVSRKEALRRERQLKNGKANQELRKKLSSEN